jgi:hypothetical protein
LKDDGWWPSSEAYRKWDMEGCDVSPKGPTIRYDGRILRSSGTWDKNAGMDAAAILAMEENFFIRKDTTVSHSVPLLEWKAIPLTEMGSCVLEGLDGVERMEMHGGLPRVCGTELDDIESPRA